MPAARCELLSVAVLLMLLVGKPGLGGAEPHRVEVDFGRALGTWRALHGINKGPLSANGLIDVSEAQSRLKIPFTRLHDCHHPNPAVVDVHAVFPDPGADPERPESYDFRATDEYIAAVRATGAEVIYRLGESIEHQTVKRYVHPPRAPARWAAVCAGIVRHYNEGWAGGFRHGIRYWEIWNEPENRPVMWTGTDEQFLELYRVTAHRLRREFPGLKIGGPGFGYYGRFRGEAFEPSPFCAAFLAMCRQEDVPLDFFSWHCYTDNPAELVWRARGVRKALDALGFQNTESHLNEWNYLPDNSWDVLSRRAAPQRRQHAAERMVGAEGAAFIAAALLELQDAPLDMANLYHAETGLFGVFTEVGAPTRSYFGLLAFSHLIETPGRVRVTGTVAGQLAVGAARSGPGQPERATLMVANLRGPASLQLSFTNLPWPAATVAEVRVVDGMRAWERAPALRLDARIMSLELAAPAVALVTLRPVAGERKP